MQIGDLLGIAVSSMALSSRSSRTGH